MRPSARLKQEISILRAVEIRQRKIALKLNPRLCSAFLARSLSPDDINSV